MNTVIQFIYTLLGLDSGYVGEITGIVLSQASRKACEFALFPHWVLSMYFKFAQIKKWQNAVINNNTNL